GLQTDHNTPRTILGNQRVILSNGDNMPIILTSGLNNSTNMTFSRGVLTTGLNPINHQLRG
ncbi:MAG: hypothetical protein FWE34_04935, partial [Defluviitaleaceae bacterium]|nr:hypothetical protein [Defluviitaleaceae bacterium]